MTPRPQRASSVSAVAFSALITSPVPTTGVPASTQIAVVAVAVGVFVGQGVFVGVTVAEGTAVGVSVAVADGLGVAVAVAVTRSAVPTALTVGVAATSNRPQPANQTNNTRKSDPYPFITI